MSIYHKLQIARIQLQGKDLKKSGNNKFAGYKYFELGDFLPAIQEIFDGLGLCGVVSFGKEEATLTIVDTENTTDRIVIAQYRRNRYWCGTRKILQHVRNAIYWYRLIYRI